MLFDRVHHGEGRWRCERLCIFAVHADTNVVALTPPPVSQENGAEVDAVDDYGSSPLLWACARGIYANCKAFIDAGADCKLANNSGTTLLHKAAINGHVRYWFLCLPASGSMSGLILLILTVS